jgi:hypothetical protein
MVEHLVWFKLKEGVGADDKAAMIRALRDLKDENSGYCAHGLWRRFQ